MSHCRVAASSRCRPPCSLRVSRNVEMQPDIRSDPVCKANDTQTVLLTVRRRFRVGEPERILRPVGVACRLRTSALGTRISDLYPRSKHPVVDRRQPRRDRQEQHDPHTDHDTNHLSRVHGLERAFVATRALSLGIKFELRD